MGNDTNSEDKRAVGELVADVRQGLNNNIREIQMLRAGLDKDDDPEEEGVPAVANPAQIDRLTRLHAVLQTALADLP